MANILQVQHQVPNRGYSMDIIDKDKLIELYGSEATALEIIRMFNQRSTELLEEMSLAIKSKDAEVLARICHKGVGQSRYIASPLVEETIRDLEKANWPEKNNYLDKLQAIIQEIEHAYA